MLEGDRGGATKEGWARGVETGKGKIGNGVGKRQGEGGPGGIREGAREGWENNRQEDNTKFVPINIVSQIAVLFK